MIGNNTLLANEATVIQALQEWFDKRMTPAPKVVSVRTKSGGAYDSPEFEVKLSEREA